MLLDPFGDNLNEPCCDGKKRDSKKQLVHRELKLAHQPHYS
jgi:hypothetical protein